MLAHQWHAISYKKYSTQSVHIIVYLNSKYFIYTFVICSLKDTLLRPYTSVFKILKTDYDLNFMNWNEMKWKHSLTKYWIFSCKKMQNDISNNLMVEEGSLNLTMFNFVHWRNSSSIFLILIWFHMWMDMASARLLHDAVIFDGYVYSHCVSHVFSSSSTQSSHGGPYLSRF